MKIFIVHHGCLPAADAPVAGVALRARALGEGLAGRGHQVIYATRRRDLNGAPPSEGKTVLGFEGRAELHHLAGQSGADRIIAVAPSELPALVDLGIPVIADLYAPRILEAQFEVEDVSAEVAEVLDAMALADGFLVTTERQRYYTLGLLPLAGVDCREDRIAVVPLSAPSSTGRRSRARAPVLIAGGVRWPWQDPDWAITVALAHLEAAGEGDLHLYGGAYPLAQEAHGFEARKGIFNHPQLLRHGMTGYDTWLSHCLKAWAALDVMAPNPERSLALSFRQMDWLGCGVPIITGSYAPIADDIEAFEAGWVIEHGDDRALKQALDEAIGGEAPSKSRGARALARRRYSVEGAAEVLDAFIEALTPRQRLPTVWSSLSRARDEGQRLKDRHKLTLESMHALAADRDKKQAEVQALDERVRTLLGTVGTLSVALEESLHIKKESLSHLSGERDEHLASAAAWEREAQRLQRDLAKKERALADETQRREASKLEVATLAERLRVCEARLDRAQQREQDAQAAAARAEGRRQALSAELGTLSADLVKKGEELADLIDSKRRAVESLQAEVDLARADAEGWRSEAEIRHRDIQKKNDELARLQAEIDAREGVIAVLEERLREASTALSARLGGALARWTGRKGASEGG